MRIASHSWPLAGLLGLLFGGLLISTQAAESSFRQPIRAEYKHADALNGAMYRKLAIARDGLTYALSDRGLARLFNDTLAPDGTYRPLAGKQPRDIAISNGDLYYLLDDQLLSNAQAGEPRLALPKGRFTRVAIAADGTVYLADATGVYSPRANGAFQEVLTLEKNNPLQTLIASGAGVFAVTDHAVAELTPTEVRPIAVGTGIRAVAASGATVWVGTTNGFFAVDRATHKVTIPLESNLPSWEITSLVAITNELWAGTTRGVVHRTAAGKYDYFASRRWLPDDAVVDLTLTANGDLLALTAKGLGRIAFKPMTLAEKAAWFETKIRHRHNRYGFSAELHLRVPGDPASEEMIDTDNDGTWSNYYMASQAFHYGATHDKTAKSNAWETFAAMERLQKLSAIKGFPARTFERTGFKVSDVDRWHPVLADPAWEWKGTTSSDEIAAHTFGAAVMYETACDTDAERQRVSTTFTRILDHILEHNLYLIDLDGKPTLWGRWHPEYVNSYPSGVGDRRLNSAELIAMLQLGYHFTHKEAYRAKAYELFDKHGYLTNIVSSMKLIGKTKAIYGDNDMGDVWNHSDDLLAFITYWTLNRYAFTPELKAKYRAATRDHWEIEKVERNPLWNFVLASTGDRNFDLDGATWTLRRYPLDSVDWTIHNSHRRDLHKLPPNFRNQQSQELLPPDERLMMRWNGNPFVLDAGVGGQLELAGDEYLLPYWMGRYLRILK